MKRDRRSGLFRVTDRANLYFQPFASLTPPALANLTPPALASFTPPALASLAVATRVAEKSAEVELVAMMAFLAAARLVIKDFFWIAILYFLLRIFVSDFSTGSTDLTLLYARVMPNSNHDGERFLVNDFNQIQQFAVWRVQKSRKPQEPRVKI
jgi:hypothetical protein